MESTTGLRIALTSAALDIVLPLLGNLNRWATTWESECGNASELRLYLPPSENADHAAITVARTIAHHVPDALCQRPPTEVGDEDGAVRAVLGMIRREILPVQDWAESWKQFFHAEKISPRIVICPEWESWFPLSGEKVLKVNPGMSFGTGQHPTTRACLQFLDRITVTDAPGALLDLGCGSGILCLAALRLGYDPVTGVDVDPVATTCAKTMLERNGLGGQARLMTADLKDCIPLVGSATVVTANILAPVLMDHAMEIRDAVRPGGHLILSGLLIEQYADVRTIYGNLDFLEVECHTDGEWRSGLFRRSS